MEFDNKPIEFQAKFKCGNRFPINQTDLIAVEETEYLDIITNKTYDSIDKDGNILHQTKLDFKYFINEDNITLLNKPDLKLSLTFYNMKSLMPGIKLLYKVDEEKIKEVLKGEESVSFLLDLNKPIPSNSTIIFDSLDELITAGRLFYEIKLENSLENDINTLVYQGSIELNARVKLMDTSYAPFFVILTLLSSLVVFLFILKKIKEGNFKSRKEKFKGEIQLKEYN